MSDERDAGSVTCREAELQGSLHRTAELHDTLGMRTDPLIVSLKPVTHGLSTLCDKTIGDAMVRFLCTLHVAVYGSVRSGVV